MFLKLLQKWKDHTGKDWTPGQTIEIDHTAAEGKTLCGQLIVDGIAEKVEAPATIPSAAPGADMTKAIGDIVDRTIATALKDEKTVKAIAGQVASIQTHDKSDDDPTFGYLPATNGRKHTKGEIEFGLGLFALDIVSAGAGFARPSERLSKCIQRSADMVKAAQRDGILKAAGSGYVVSSDESAGALMPPEFSLSLMDMGLEVSVVRPRATIIPCGLAGIEFPRPKNYDHSAGTIYGGVKAYWLGENSQITESQGKMETIKLNPKGLAALSYASHKTIMGAPPAFIGGFVLPSLARAIAFAEDDAFLNGDGAAKPLGLLKSPARVTLTAKSGQTSTAKIIVVENIDDMEARIHIERAASTVFLYNRPELLNWLRSLYRLVGTAGGEVERIFRFAGPENPLASTLDGYPILDTEFAAAAATEGDLIFTDLSQYLVADDRGGAEIAQSIHLKFDYGQSAFRIIKYVDGQPINSSAFTRKNGSNTTSSIVTIATRT